jgi:hypothetical protein
VACPVGTGVRHGLPENGFGLDIAELGVKKEKGLKASLKSTVMLVFGSDGGGSIALPLHHEGQRGECVNSCRRYRL